LAIIIGAFILLNVGYAYWFHRSAMRTIPSPPSSIYSTTAPSTPEYARRQSLYEPDGVKMEERSRSSSVGDDSFESEV
jgi:hypothetical protein